MYLALAGIKWQHVSHQKEEDNIMLNMNFDLSSVQAYTKNSAWVRQGDLTDTELIDACGTLNEHFRNTKHDPSAAILCLSSKAGIVPTLEFFVMPVKCANGVWFVFAYDLKTSLLHVSNDKIDYDTISSVVDVLVAHLGNDTVIGDFVSLNCDNTHNSAASSLVLLTALLKSWHHSGTPANLDGYMAVGCDTSQLLVSWSGRQLSYADALPSILRAAWSTTTQPATGLVNRGCVYNDVFDLL